MWMWLGYGFLAWMFAAFVHENGIINTLKLVGVGVAVFCVAGIVSYNAKGALGLIGVHDEGWSTGIGSIGGIAFFFGLLVWLSRKRGPFRK